MENLTPLNYWKILMKISSYCRFENYISKNYSCIKAGNEKNITASLVIKEYKRYKLITENNNYNPSKY